MPYTNRSSKRMSYSFCAVFKWFSCRYRVRRKANPTLVRAVFISVPTTRLNGTTRTSDNKLWLNASRCPNCEVCPCFVSATSPNSHGQVITSLPERDALASFLFLHSSTPINGFVIIFAQTSGVISSGKKMKRWQYHILICVFFARSWPVAFTLLCNEIPIEFSVKTIIYLNIPLIDAVEAVKRSFEWQRRCGPAWNEFFGGGSCLGLK